TLQKILTALEEGLQSEDPRVCASSAIAVSWIGPRARQTVPLLIPLLESGDNDVPQNAMEALGEIGPDARQAIAPLKKILTGPDISIRVNAARALRGIQVDPSVYVPTLIDLLGEKREEHYACIELSHLGDPAVPALLKAMKDKNATRRMNAAYTIGNMAGWNNLTKDHDQVTEALIALTQDQNPDVVFKAIQAIGSVKAIPEISIPVLIPFLDHSNVDIARVAAECIGDFEEKGQSAVTSLIEVLRNPGTHESWYYWTVTDAIRRIGLNQKSAEEISQLDMSEIPYCSKWIFIPLCEYPDFALSFLKNNPGAADVAPRDYETLMNILRDETPQYQQLRKQLYQSQKLPLAIMAQSADPRFLPVIQERMKTADSYTGILINACARACGAEAERIVQISETEPGDFKPASAWPGTDPRRKSEELGHGDGSTEVIVTGRILRKNKQPVEKPCFYRVNDSMLLGEKIKEEVPITYDKKTGRFVFVTDVFAAYQSGEKKSEPGPYQTGSSMIQIEAQGCKPLTVQFYDEMPDVEITLSDAN
ncbi:MAG: HEAT repeat domain-containing protein, partial [Planctomycetaceae bacterium]|nr:HEAT repeat domain-containing protein [Planctomycetaceae bacterium]